MAKSPVETAGDLQMGAKDQKTCRACGCRLIEGETWSYGLVKSRTYLCRKCNSEKGKAHYRQHSERALEVRRARLADTDACKRDSETKKNYYRRNKEKWSAYHATAKEKTRTDPWARASRLLTWVRTRAAKTGKEFDLDVEWIAERMGAGICEASGIALELQLAKIGRIHPWGPSVDRIDPSKGYTKDNCQIVCWAYNMAKSDWDHETVKRLAIAIASK